MAFADGAVRKVLEGICPVPGVLLGEDVRIGDLVGMSSGQAVLAIAGTVAAEYVVAEPGLAGQRVRVYRAAVVGGFSGGTPGQVLYLSGTTGGGYAAAGSTAGQQAVGQMLTETEAFICPERWARDLQASFPCAAADVGRVFFVARRPMLVTKIREIHATAAGQAGTMTVERLQGTTAPGSGDDLLGATKINLQGTANTEQTPALTSTTANLKLQPGDRLALKLASGAATGLANAVVTVELALL